MIEDQLYRETILEVAQNPKNKGEISNPDLEARLLNPLCGDEVRIQLKIHPTPPRLRGARNSRGIIEKAAFSGNGCAISQASASLLVSYIEGKGVEEVKRVNKDDILGLLAINPTPARIGCALLSLNVLKEALINGTEGKSR